MITHTYLYGRDECPLSKRLFRQRRTRLKAYKKVTGGFAAQVYLPSRENIAVLGIRTLLAQGIQLCLITALTATL